MSPVAQESTRGRPRSEERTAAILDATVELMHEVGWDGLRVADVASRAGAGLATVYRRWPTKEDLVADALRHDIAFELTETGDARNDLRALLESMSAKLDHGQGQVFTFLAAAREHEAMAKAMDEKVRCTVRPTVTRLLAELIGADHPGADFLADSILGALLVRCGMFEEDVDPVAFADEVLSVVDGLAASRS